MNDAQTTVIFEALENLQKQILALRPAAVVDHAAHIRDIILKDSSCMSTREQIALYIQTCRDLKLL